nr:hypothetical protein [uncultured Fusobacterium sp.]
MMEVKFIGTPAEVKEEIKEFIRLTDVKITEYSVGEVRKVETVPMVQTQQVHELPKVTEPKLPTTPVTEEQTAVQESTVLPTLPTATVEYTVEDLQRIGASLLQKDPNSLALLSNTLKNYGANSVGDLAKEHYGAFVQDLKSLGADV